MRRRITKRDAVALLVIAVLSASVFSSPTLEIVQGLSIDILTALRFRLFAAPHDPPDPPVVVVAIDEETYQTPPFKGSPTLTWTREIGRVLTAIVDGGAKVVGFDLVFPTSIEQSEMPFADEILGTRVRGFDRDFLRALATASSAGKVVLGEVESRDQPIRPSPGQRAAVRQQSNIRPLNVYTDADGVVRRLPLTFAIDGKPIPSMALELASRALDTRPEQMLNGIVTLAGYRIPSAVPNTFTLNFRGGGDIPSFSFADLRACLESGNADFFHREFDRKVVIFGTSLDSEDRKLTSMRFARPRDGQPAPRCAIAAQPSDRQTSRNSVAGVFIHATAVENLIDRNAVTELSRTPVTAIVFGFALLAAVFACLLTPLAALLAYLPATAIYTIISAAVFLQSFALPLSEPILAGFAAIFATVGYRFVVTDREGRLLRRSFGLYLAPQVVETMVMTGKPPVLGGEMRNVTVFFSDIAGFSTIAEKMSPQTLVAMMNEYLSAMTDIIEGHGGYVDKYIGDSIVAVFGAPVDDPNHAVSAVSAALDCGARLKELNQDHAAFRGLHLAHRIGLNSGEALVGNIGSRRRFNYTVMSDAVNVASRLESANKYLATSILASEATVRLTGAAFAWRELDSIRVKGRVDPVRIYEPLAEAGKETPEQTLLAAAYAEGLARFRVRDFRGAEVCFDRLAERDPPSALFRNRAHEFDKRPPPPDWEAVNTLEGK